MVNGKEPVVRGGFPIREIKSGMNPLFLTQKRRRSLAQEGRDRLYIYDIEALSLDFVQIILAVGCSLLTVVFGRGLFIVR